MLTSPLAAAAPWTWTQGTTSDLPDDLAGAFPSSARDTTSPDGGLLRPRVTPEALTGSGGTARPLLFPFSGTVHHEANGTVHWIWGTPADLAAFPALRSHMPFGNPLIALRFVNSGTATDSDFPSSGVTRGAPATLGGTGITVSNLTIVAAFPLRPGFDTLSVLRALLQTLTDAAAETDGGAALTVQLATWSAFLSEFSGLDAPLRLLEPAGRPISGRPVTIETASSANTATLEPVHRGNALAATGLTRADLTAESRLIVASTGEEAAFAGPTGAVPAAGLDLSGGTATHLDLALLNDWFADQGSGALARFTRGNRITPLINGPAYFDALFTELHDTGGAAPPAFYLSGSVIEHEAVLASAASGVANRSLDTLIPALAGEGGEARFLAMQVLQLEPGFVETVEKSALVASALLAILGGSLTFAQDSRSWEQPNFFAHSQALAVSLFFAATMLDDLLESFEINQGAIDALAAIPGVEGNLDPYPAECPDNPICDGTASIIQLAHEVQRRFNAFRQKMAVVRNASGLHAYCGGIDLSANRLDDRDHGSRTPFHDVHARVDGPAVGELTQTFIERWNRPAATGDPARPALGLAAAGALDGLPTDGPDIVQVARTYFGPAATDTERRLPFAPAGERTILDTTLRAIARARRYIYIEDQYLTPPGEYVVALREAAREVSGPLIIAIPSTPDQPFGFAPRQDAIRELEPAWGDRLKVGYMRNPFHRVQTNRTKAVGRLWLTEDVAETDKTIKVGPPDRMPKTPFWLTVGNEAMWAKGTVPGTGTASQIELRVDRGSDSRLFGASSGSTKAKHKAEASVCCGSFAGIYVHSKLMLIDDCFASIGSANLNRRGLYSDGECNLFAMPEGLTNGDNWIRDLRIRLWAEMTGVEENYAFAAFADPSRNTDLFDRNFVVGNRFSPFAAQPFATDLDLQITFTQDTGALTGLIEVIKVGLGTLAVVGGLDSQKLFDAIIDPSSQVAP
ncbi:MAG: phospholipase D-like domain-containing protein [Pseudomonadota bacterium]